MAVHWHLDSILVEERVRIAIKYMKLQLLENIGNLHLSFCNWFFVACAKQNLNPVY